MTRDLGERALLLEYLPDWGALLAAALTQLGDGWFIVLLFAGVLWLFPDNRAAIVAVFGAWLAGIALYSGLKSFFGLPRPPTPTVAPTAVPGLFEPLYGAIATPGGYGFPSGHAVNATTVYLGLAMALPIWTRQRRFLIGGGIAATVCLTRVVLGVHYLVDVVAGALLAGGVLVALRAVIRWRPAWKPIAGFVLVVPAAVGSMLLTGPGRQPLGLLLVAVLGTVLCYQYFELGSLPATDDPG